MFSLGGVRRGAWSRTAIMFGAVVTASFLRVPEAHAQPDTLPDPNDFQVHAFVSQGFIKSSANNYLSYSQRGAFDYTEAAVNIAKNLTDDLRVGAQLFTRD